MPMPSMKEVVANRPSMIDFLFRLSCISSFPFPFSAASPLSSAALSLHAFRGSLPEPSRSILLWNESSSPCRWPGVGCSADPSSSVDSLNLSSLGLHSGLTDASVAHLCSIDTLVSVNLSDNRFAGAIPPSFQSCTRLHTLLLSRNLFTGRLPPGLFRSPHLVGLDVSDNSLYGDIPAEVGLCSRLQYLSLYNNSLTGSIRSEIFRLPNLEFLYLQTNKLAGNLPDFPRSCSLLEIWIQENGLSGSLPRSLSNCRNLTSLFASRNGSEGRIPEVFGKMFHLEFLHISENC